MNVLIINIGPYGDVLRTTILLNQFKNDNIYWLTSRHNMDIVISRLIHTNFFIEKLNPDYYDIHYDLVISLNEEYPFKEDVEYDKLIGIKKNGEYTEDSSYWFDMSMVSKYGKEKANELKLNNRKTYNQILIEMVGGEWDDQEYVIPHKSSYSNKIGLIKSIDGNWKSKKWNGFDQLYDLLKNEYDVEFLDKQERLKYHMYDINDCGLIVCPDTFGMHLGLAYRKKVVALFNCTSPYEIYNYGRLHKIVSPLYEEFFYTKEYNEKLSNSIDVQTVYEKIKEII
jgi:heptosyltransferase II